MLEKIKTKKRRIAIIGGGFTGLLCGFRLSKKYDVVILEKKNEIGGLLQTFRHRNYHLDKYYHHIFARDHAFLNLLDELDARDLIVWHQFSTSFYRDNRFFRFDGVRDALRLSFLRFSSRIRFILGIILILSCHGKIEKCSKRSFGSEVWQKIWRPLAISKFSEDYSEVDSRWLAERIKKRLFTGNVLGYPKNNFKDISKLFETKIKENGGKIICSSEISKIKKIGNGYKLLEQNYDMIISTIPKILLNNIYPNKKIAGAKYFGIICIICHSKKPFTKYFWNNILTSKYISGIIEQTNLIKMGDDHFCYLSKYEPSDSRLFLMDKEALMELYRRELIRMLKHDNFTIVDVFRNKYAQPLVKKKSDTKIDDNFYSISTENIFPQDRGLNEAVIEVNKLINEYFNEK